MPSAAASRRKAKGKRQKGKRLRPAALERHFGRDTLLYFPMERGTAAPVALQTIIDGAKLIDAR